MAKDTIFALATPPGRGAVAVVRLSGPEAGSALARLAGSVPEPRQASLRVLRNREGAVLDQALVLWFVSPSSFTGEDRAERENPDSSVHRWNLVENVKTTKE